MHPDGMGWSWEELQATPPYVKRYCLDFIGIRRRVAANAQERAELQAKLQRGG